MNFSDFAKQKIKEEKIQEKKQMTQEDALSTYNQLKDLNADQLSSRLYQQVKQQKESGTFNYEMLKNSVESIKGFLAPQTYQNLISLLETLK